VGRIEVEMRSVGNPATEPYLSGQLTGTAEGVQLIQDEPGIVDWLDQCPATGECRVPLEISVTAELDPDGNLVDVPVAWSAEVRLEAFDGRELPADGIELAVR